MSVRAAQLQQLLPAEVLLAVASPQMWDEALHPQELPFARDMNDKRRREFQAGRACARRVLAQLGYPEQALAVGAHRQPLWPQGVVGSITHCGDFCAAVGAPSTQFAGLGIDVEEDSALDESLLDVVCTPRERQAVTGLASPLHQAKAVFSIKESLFKAHFPLLQRWIDFLDVELSLDAQNQRFEARGAYEGAPFVAGSVSGRFGRVDGLIFSVVALPAGGPGRE